MIAVHVENGRVECRELPRPDRPAGWARMRLLAAGICNTDLELQRGYYGFAGTPGHEFVGEVIEADRRELVGERVVGEINVSCGECSWCVRGLGRHCPARTVLGIVRQPGAFAEELLLPERNLRVVPAEVQTDDAVFIEPLAAACEILDQVAIPRGEPVAVLGDGKLGLLVAQALDAHGLWVHHFGKHREKLLLSDAAGIETYLVSDAPAAAYDWVVDATGSPEGLRQAVRMARPRGTVVLKSTMHGEVPVDTAPIIVNEITLVGSRCGRFESALDLLRQQRISFEGMVSAHYPLQQAPEAFEHAARPGTLKVLLHAH